MRSLRLRQMRRQLVQLYLGLVLYGVSASLLVLARLGLDPWDVFHQGLARHSGLAIGTWSILVGLCVMVLWIPLRQRPGIGTVSNVVLIGGTMDVVLGHVSSPHALGWRIACLVAGVFFSGVATGAYIGAGLGPGPRDGLMTGLVARGGSIRVVRTSARATVLVTGLAPRRDGRRRHRPVRGVDRPARARVRPAVLGEAGAGTCY